MKKKRQIAYDEASSGSSDSDNSSIDSSLAVGVHGYGEQPERERRQPVDEESPSSDDDDDEINDNKEDSDDNSTGNTTEKVQKISSSSVQENGLDGFSLEDNDEEDDEEDLLLDERIRRQDEKGVSLEKRRERKRSALEVASDRLAKFKKAKLEATETSGNKLPNTKEVKKKKKSKHAPTEVSSKRSEFFRRGARRLNESGIGVEVGAHRYKPLDPRTSSLSGHLNEEQFEKNYEFLQEMRKKEISQLKKKITARKLSGKKGKRMRRQLDVSLSEGSLENDENRLLQLKQEKANFDRRKVERAAKQAVKRKIRGEVEEGKRGAFFLKRKEKKRLEFEAKMEELKKRGGHKAVEKALTKRRRKAKSRDASIFAK